MFVVPTPLQRLLVFGYIRTNFNCKWMVVELVKIITQYINCVFHWHINKLYSVNINPHPICSSTFQEYNIKFAPRITFPRNDSFAVFGFTVLNFPKTLSEIVVYYEIKIQQTNTKRWYGVATATPNSLFITCTKNILHKSQIKGTTHIYIRHYIKILSIKIKHTTFCVSAFNFKYDMLPNICDYEWELDNNIQKQLSIPFKKILSKKFGNDYFCLWVQSMNLDLIEFGFYVLRMPKNILKVRASIVGVLYNDIDVVHKSIIPSVVLSHDDDPCIHVGVPDFLKMKCKSIKKINIQIKIKELYEKYDDRKSVMQSKWNEYGVTMPNKQKQQNNCLLM
eukprot:50915_1